LWLKQLAFDFGIPVDTVSIMSDNQSSIKLLKNPVSLQRAKHIDIAHHFARERVMRKEVEFRYVPTEEMLADGLTKALGATKHKFCFAGMGVG